MTSEYLLVTGGLVSLPFAVCLEDLLVVLYGWLVGVVVGEDHVVFLPVVVGLSVVNSENKNIPFEIYQPQTT